MPISKRWRVIGERLMQKYGEKFIDEHNTIGKLEKFGKRFWISNLNSFNEYEEIGWKPKGRMSMQMLNALNWLFLVKFAVPLLTNNRLVVRTLFADIGWIMVHNPKPSITLCHITCVLAVMIPNFYWKHSEWNRSNGMIKFLAKFKDNKLHKDVKLYDQRLIKKYRIKTCVFINYSIAVVHKTCTAFLTTAFVSLTLLGYSRPDSGYHWASVVFWSAVTVVWVSNYFAVVIFIFSAIFSSTLYLKYKFIEINSMFLYSLNQTDTHSVMRAMRCHNSVSTLVKDITGCGNVLMFQFYYLCTPALEFLLYNCYDPNSHIIWKINTAVVFTSISLSLVFLVLFMSSFSRNAHKPYKTLCKILLKPGMGLNQNQELKVNEFIEHLSSGPEIGFYCLDLFPLSSYEFMQYLSFCSRSYIMILQNI